MALDAVSANVLSSPLGKPASGLGAIEKLLAVLLCSLAFLLASTPARNSDLWLHLASGRWLSTERLPDGTDPFSSTTQGVFWVNHTWLSDILLYQIFKLGDGKALIVAKGALVAVLAALLLCFRRRSDGMGVLTLAGFAAVLALGPWLVLQPALLSLVGVLLTLYLLERPSLVEGIAAERARRPRWLLVPLFALWANLDAWFVLGPILVGLYALGELLRRSTRGRSVSEGTSLAYASASDILLFLAGLAACLATPYHYHIFSWPTPLGLTAAEQALRQDPLGQTLVVSPFAARFMASPLLRSPGLWAYYFLLAAGALSFVFAMPNLHPGRLLAWLALAALSIYQARMIPFFAVIAAPVLALNAQVGGAERSEAHRGLRMLGVLSGVVLLVLAWPGWLQLTPYQARDWAIEPDGSLVRMAQRLKREHAKANFPPDRFTLTFSPEAAHYLAWFCPEEKGFVDSRWPLFDGVAADYVRMRRCLLQEGGDGQELAALLDAHRIDRVLLYDADRQRMARAYRHLFLAAGPASHPSLEWELLAVEGGAALFRRRRGTASSPEAFDYRRAAYHPTVDQCAPPAPPAPQPPHWYDVFRRRPDPGSADREEAALHLLTFDLQTAELADQWLLAQATGLIGGRPGVELAARLLFIPPMLPSPPEPLLLAVRAARHALAANPDDARAFLLLGEAYVQLAQKTREASWQILLPDLAVLRQAQMLTDLEQAVLLRPDLAAAHALLAQIYYEMGQMDRRLDHLRALVQLADKHAASTAALRAEVENAEKLVNESEKTYQANLTGKTNPSKVLDRAQLAARFGLTRKALEMLQESYPDIFGRPGMEYELDLMMKAGQSYEVRELLGPVPELKTDLDTYHTYHWLRARAAASCGDYAEADAELDKDCEPFRRIGLSAKLLVPVRSGMALHIARAVLARSLEAEGAAGRVTAIHFQVESLNRVGAATDLLLKEADRQVLRGLLALEAGAVEAAKQHFRAALNVWQSEAAAEAGAGLDFPARPIAQEMLSRLQGDKVTR
jgi:tetratricopeptide (TPR) repeat protein